MIIQFHPNVPEILQLSDPSGDLEGSQVFYPTSDGRTLALPEHAARKLAALSIQPGEEISITRYVKPGEPGNWVICLTPRSEKARADAEIAAQELRTRQLAQETRENPGRQLEASIAQLRQMPKSATSATQERAETGRGTGTYGPVPAALPAPRNRRNPPIGQVSYRVALKEITSTVLELLDSRKEQWDSDPRQGLISTLFISACKAGSVAFDFVGGEQ